MPSPATPPPRPRPSRHRPALFHRHTTDAVTTSTTSGRSGSGKSVAFSGFPLLAQLALGRGVIAGREERFNQSQMSASHPIPPPISPIASDPLIEVPIVGPALTSEHDPISADPPGPPPPFKGKAKGLPIELLSASIPTNGSLSPGLPEVSPGARPRQEVDGDREIERGRHRRRSRSRAPRTSKRNSPISYSEGHALAHEIGASAYIECSSLTLVNVVAVFEEAVKVAGEPPQITIADDDG